MNPNQTMLDNYVHNSELFTIYFRKMMSENGDSRKRKREEAGVEVEAEIHGGNHVKRVHISLEVELPETGDKFELDKMLLQIQEPLKALAERSQYSKYKIL